MNKTLTILVTLMFFVLFSSCNNVKKDFTEKERMVIDSVYRIKKKELKGRLDSLCDSVYQAEYPVYVDSIKKIRKKEILDLIGK